MRELGFRWIYNMSYSPEWNPIELMFLIIKREFKRLRARKLTGISSDTHEDMIEKAVKSVKMKDIGVTFL